MQTVAVRAATRAVVMEEAGLAVARAAAALAAVRVAALAAVWAVGMTVVVKAVEMAAAERVVGREGVTWAAVKEAAATGRLFQPSISWASKPACRPWRLQRSNTRLGRGNWR